MAYDDLQIFVLFVQNLCRFPGYIRVAGSVETVTSDLVLLIILIRQTVHISFLRHGLMESGIEYSYHGSGRHQLFAGIDADQVCRVM